MAGFMACGAHPLHKTHCLWADRSACPCFIDLTLHKFPTSAFPVLDLTGERFSEGMRSDRGREMEGKGKGGGRAGHRGGTRRRMEMRKWRRRRRRW